VCRINVNEERIDGPMSLSTDERLLARIELPLDNGAPTLSVTHLASGRRTVLNVEQGSTPVCGVEFGPAVSPTRTSLFLTLADAVERPASVYALVLDVDGDGSVVATVPVQVFHEPDPRCFVDVRRTKGGEYVAISSSSKTDDEVCLVGRPDRHQPGIAEWTTKTVREREDGVRYNLDCGTDGDLVILAHLAAADPCRTDLGSDRRAFLASVQDLPLTRSFGRPMLPSGDTTGEHPHE